MEFTSSSRLTLVPLELVKDRKNYIVEDKQSGDFFEMPVVCVDAIRMMQQDLPLAEIEGELRQKYSEEEIDLIEFAQQLIELQLVAQIDQIDIQQNRQRKEQLGFQWISPQVGQIFFHKITIRIYLLLFVTNLGLLIFRPSLFPNYQDLFVFDFMAFNIPTWMGITGVLILIHELGHILAIRAYDLPTKLTVGHRLFLIVLETDLSAAWKLPAKARNTLYLAGLCFDTVILFLALIFQLILTNSSEVFQGILHVIVLDTFIRMMYQLGFYMKTDLYFVYENLTGCYNLMEGAQQLIRKHLPIVKHSSLEEVIYEGERKVVASYAIFYLLGVTITLFLYFFFYLPQLIYSTSTVLPGLNNGITSLSFWDGLLFLLQLFVGFFILIRSWSKKYFLLYKKKDHRIVQD